MTASSTRESLLLHGAPPPFTPEMARGMSEATLQTSVTGLAQSLGYLCYHTHDSRRSQPGFPDLVMVRAISGRLIFAELKTERGRQSVQQREWERALHASGQGEVYLWRPTDWLSGAITQILRRRPA